MVGPFTPEDEPDLESRVEFEEQDPEGFDEYVAAVDEDNAAVADEGREV